METGLIILIVELVGGVALIGGLVLRKRVFTGEPYEFEMILMNPGINKHELIRGGCLEFKHKIGDKEYEIKPDRLYRVKPRRLDKIIMRVKSVKKRFAVVYQYEKNEPIKPESVKVTAQLLKEVNESRALDKALRSEFSIPFDLKKILLVVGVLVVAVIVYVLVSAEVTL